MEASGAGSLEVMGPPLLGGGSGMVSILEVMENPRRCRPSGVLGGRHSAGDGEPRGEVMQNPGALQSVEVLGVGGSPDLGSQRSGF